MIRLTQRQINHGVFGLMAIVAASVCGLMMMTSTASFTQLLAITAYACSCVVLWVAYWRGWEYARQALVIILTLILALSTVDQTPQGDFSHIIYAVPVFALVLTSPIWVLGSALVLLAAFASSAGGGPYSNPINLLIFTVTVGGMVLSRLAVDNAQHLEAATRAAESERIRAEAERSRAEGQASELALQNVEQQRLLDLVATLETPTIAVADGVLLAPIVGMLDSRRAQTLTARLLRDVNQQRAKRVILDIAGVTAVDTQVAQSLIQSAQALQLLGCTVTITGISATVATTLTHLGIALDGVTTARSPQEVLAQN